MADNRYMVWYGFYLGSMLEKSISNLGILLLAEVNKIPSEITYAAER